MTDSILKKIALFKHCSEDFFTKTETLGSAQKHQKGKILFLHEDEADHFFVIRSGWVKLFRETLDGTQAVVDILTQSHIFGETAIFQDNLYPYSAEVVEPAEIISLPLSLLKSEIEGNIQFAYDMLGSMAKYRRQQDREIEHRDIQNAPSALVVSCYA